MSYCVNCGVKLDDSASRCPLCHTKVINPNQHDGTNAPTPFPKERGVVAPVSKWELAILISAMFASVAVCCAILNIFLPAERTWSLYVIGAAVMLWIWFVPPLLLRGMHLCLRLMMDVAAVGIYIYLISIDLGGHRWFVGLALPIILLGGAIMLFMGLMMQDHKRSTLTSFTLVIGCIGAFLAGIEFFTDRYVLGGWSPGWSLVVLTVCVALVIPLVIVRRVPSLREEMRRRFHM